MDLVAKVAIIGVFISMVATHYSKTQKARDIWHNVMAGFSLVFLAGLVLGGWVGN